MLMDKVIVRFKRSGNKAESVPSESLNLALSSLADSDELQPLLYLATEAGRALAFNIFQNRQGHPFLINITQEEP